MHRREGNVCDVKENYTDKQQEPNEGPYIHRRAYNESPGYVWCLCGGKLGQAGGCRARHWVKLGLHQFGNFLIFKQIKVGLAWWLCLRSLVERGLANPGRNSPAGTTLPPSPDEGLLTQPLLGQLKTIGIRRAYMSHCGIHC